MMPGNIIKEKISLRYLELIAAYNAYSTTIPGDDFGEDLHVVEVGYNEERRQLVPSGRYLSMQLKSTTLKSIQDKDGYIKYDLKVKNYNDLIDRKESYSPIILILFLLPEKNIDWIELSDEELVVRKCAYWYLPKSTDENTKNTSTKIIEIDKQNLITLETFSSLFENFFDE